MDTTLHSYNIQQSLTTDSINLPPHITFKINILSNYQELCNTCLTGSNLSSRNTPFSIDRTLQMY